MDGDQKFWLGIWCSSITGIILLVSTIMVLNQIERQSYLEAGLQECAYYVVGNQYSTTTWMKECPNGGIVMPSVENVK